MTGEPTLKRIVLGDAAWLGIVSIAALSIGIATDQLFRPRALGLLYQPPAERITGSLAESIPLVMMDEVVSLMSRPNVLVLDARPRVFYELGHLPGAKSLSREGFDQDLATLEKDLRAGGRTLLVYCSDADCEDSAIVAKALQQRGYGPLALFPGGYAEWEAGGHAVEVSP